MALATGSGLPAVVVMGVAGCGKSLMGTALAGALGARFIEGDRLHPPESIALMAAGTPLTDEDRAGWLDAVGREIARQRKDRRVVATCSALKRRYRDRLRAHAAPLVFLHLALDPAAARQRVASREGHFMPAGLVDSQFAALEPPQADETALTLDATRPVKELLAEAIALLRAD